MPIPFRYLHSADFYLLLVEQQFQKKVAKFGETLLKNIRRNRESIKQKQAIDGTTVDSNSASADRSHFLQAKKCHLQNRLVLVLYYNL